MRVLIFGGNGFLGSSLTTLLRSEGHLVATVSRSNQGSDYNFDIGDHAAYSVLPDNTFDIVVNCATILPGGDYLDNDYLDKIYKTNILGSQNICKWIGSQSSVKKIINCSSLVVIGKPWPLGLKEDHSAPPVGRHVLYSSSKLVQELIFETFTNEQKLSLVQIRFSALYGETMPWSGVVCSLIDQARDNGKISLTNATKVSADFLHIDDAASIVNAAINSEITGIVNGASGIETTIMEIAEIIKRHSKGVLIIENSEEENFQPNRALISTEKLSTVIDTRDFMDFSEGVNKLMNL